MIKLKWLWLNNNQITSLPVDVFANLAQIREIYLFNNSITTVPNGVFKDNVIIKHLYLHENLIPVNELDCCQLCGVPEPVDVKWGLIEQDETLRCGYSGTVNCIINGVSQLCYPVKADGTGQTFIFSGVGHSWQFMGFVVSGLVLFNSIMILTA